MSDEQGGKWGWGGDNTGKRVGELSMYELNECGKLSNGVTEDGARLLF